MLVDIASSHSTPFRRAAHSHLAMHGCYIAIQPFHGSYGYVRNRCPPTRALPPSLPPCRSVEGNPAAPTIVPALCVLLRREHDGLGTFVLFVLFELVPDVGVYSVRRYRRHRSSCRPTPKSPGTSIDASVFSVVTRLPACCCCCCRNRRT